MEPIEILMTAKRETRGAWRFEADDPAATVRDVYLRKESFADAEVPQKIVITIEAADAPNNMQAEGKAQ